jgi:hypothetical protein
VFGEEQYAGAADVNAVTGTFGASAGSTAPVTQMNGEREADPESSVPGLLAGMVRSH